MPLSVDSFKAHSTINSSAQLIGAERVHVSAWLTPPKDLALRDNEIHVWRASLELKPPRIQSLEQTLTVDERTRSEHFFFESDRKHFIAARGLLRAILGRYLHTDPKHLRFCYSPYGKPSLTNEYSGKTYTFNLSHSRGLALFAITLRRKLGVDLECIRMEIAEEQIAKQFLSPREIVALSSLPTEQKKKAFFRCWTRKEAYIKARGEGLTIRLDQFDVSLAPGEPPRLLCSAEPFDDVSNWSIKDLHPASGYTAALAVKGHGLQLKCWQWPDAQ